MRSSIGSSSHAHAKSASSIIGWIDLSPPNSLTSFIKDGRTNQLPSPFGEKRKVHVPEILDAHSPFFIISAQHIPVSQAMKTTNAFSPFPEATRPSLQISGCLHNADRVVGIIQMGCKWEVESRQATKLLSKETRNKKSIIILISLHGFCFYFVEHKCRKERTLTTLITLVGNLDQFDSKNLCPLTGKFFQPHVSIRHQCHAPNPTSGSDTWWPHTP